MAVARKSGVQRLSAVKRVGLHERAATRMRTLIVRGDLAPGAAIQETQISKQLGVSRTPLREAIKLLANEGLIELRPNRSPRIADLSPESVAELFEALAAIERGAAELAAQRLTVRDLQRLRALQSRMEAHHASRERIEYSAINGEIHSLIVRGAGNGPLREAHGTLFFRAERARFLVLDAGQRWTRSVDEHAAILAALEARDGVAAGALLQSHVLRTGDAMKSRLGVVDPERPAA